MTKADRYAHLQDEPTSDATDDSETTEAGSSTPPEGTITVEITDGEETAVVNLEDTALEVEDVRDAVESLEHRRTMPAWALAPVDITLTSTRQTMRATTAVQRYAAFAPVRLAKTIRTRTRD